MSLSVTFQIKIKNGELVLGNNDDTTIMFDVRMLCFIVWLFIATQSTKEVIEPSVFCRQDVSFLSIHCDFDFIFILTLKPYSYFGKNKKELFGIDHSLIQNCMTTIFIFLLPFVHPITSSTYLSLTNHYFCVLLNVVIFILDFFEIKKGHFKI